jgi:drug/metabolite transporter (DMT)-like permease
MSDAAVGGQTTAAYLRGALYGLAAVSIWSGWIVVARLGLRTSLTPWDIAALRFGVAGVLLLPHVLIKGLAFRRLGLVGLAAVVFGGAAPVLLANSGLQFASAAHAGALFPGVMPLMVALLAALVVQEPFARAKKIGFMAILPGVLGIAWSSVAAAGSSANIGDVLFLCSGLAWACYTVAMRRARLDGLHAAAISAVGAMLLYLPVFALAAGTTPVLCINRHTGQNQWVTPMMPVRAALARLLAIPIFREVSD